MFKFVVTDSSGAELFKVDAKSRDVIRWEAANKANSLHKLNENLRMTDLTEVAFYAASRQGLYDGSLVDFKADCDIELEDEDEDGPLEKAA